MRIGRVAVAALAFCLAGWDGAQAQNTSVQLDGPYLRVETGWNHLDDLTGQGGSVGAASGLSFDENNAEGWLLGGAYGYKMGPWHFEINIDYRNNAVGGISIGSPGLLPLKPGNQFGYSGNITAISDMINVTYDLPWSLGPKLTPYIGAGAGYLNVKLNSIAVNGVAISGANTNDGVAAIQPILGLRYDIDPVRAISVEYRMLNGFSPQFNDGAGQRFSSGDYRSHSIIFALTWSLGGIFAPAPTAAAAPAEAAVPPPPPPAGARNEFIVYFDFDKSSLTPAARQILDEATAAYMQNKPVKISVTGYTDTVGTVAYNLALSVRRADAVRDYLKGKGVPVNAMDVEGKGKTNLRVPTPDGVREPQNRRVEIIMP
jgi:outer membrane protein OmpA-like peptidoglycan-associated protein